MAVNYSDTFELAPMPTIAPVRNPRNGDLMVRVPLGPAELTLMHRALLFFWENQAAGPKGDRDIEQLMTKLELAETIRQGFARR